MNKKYIDFVPKQINQASTPRVVRPRVASSNSQNFGPNYTPSARPVITSSTRPASTPNIYPVSTPASQATSSVATPQPVNSISAAAAKAKKIPKIPLIGKRKNASDSSPKSTNSDQIMQEALTTASNLDGKKMQLPKPQFVRTAVEKRPLSRNVYQPKKVVEPKEEPKGTITIIDKPEKDSRIGLIVTIIITIILGAASGTIAFLLLPK